MRRDPPRRRVRLLQQPKVEQQRHFVAAGRGGYLCIQKLRHPFGAYRLSGPDIFAYDSAEDLHFPSIQIHIRFLLSFFRFSTLAS